MKLTRKLSVILHADVVGSTALVQQHETLAHERMQSAFIRFSQTVKDYSGVTHELRGDALVAEFARASDAVCAALAYQKENIEHIAQYDDDIKPQLRIGIAMGEVVIADNTITGGGVVMAQRLEQLAERGGICIQGAIYETVPRRLPFDYQSLGEQQLKGFDEPVRVFSVQLSAQAQLPSPEFAESGISDNESSADQPLQETGRQRKRGKSAILLEPIEVMNRSEEALQLASAVEGAILTSLANSTGSRLVTDITEANFEIKIGLQVVRQRYRSTVDLIDLAAREQFSSTRFDGEFEDIFETVDQLCFRVSTAIRNNILLREAEILKAIPTHEKTIEDLLNEAGYLSYSANFEVQQVAQSMIDQVIEQDPDNFMALAMRAMGGISKWLIGFRPINEEDGEDALARARKARSINQHSDFAHYAVSFVQLFYKQDYDAALRSASKSLELNTGWIDPIGQIGRIEIVTGQPEQGIIKSMKAFQTYPQSGTAFLHADAIALGYFVCRNYPLAIEWAKRVDELQPDLGSSKLLLVSALANAGDIDEAGRQGERFLLLYPDFSIAEMRLWPFQDASDWERFKSGLLTAGLPA